MVWKTIILVLIAASSLRGEAKPHYNTAKTLPPPSAKQIEMGAKGVEVPKGTKIPKHWIPYLNPAYEEFWQEGNHKPDAGFMLLARDISRDNARLWLIRMETKAKALETMWPVIEEEYKSLIKKGIIKDRYGLLKDAIAQKKQPELPSFKSLRQVDIFFLFSPGCRHCQNLAKTLKPLGEKVLPLQIDGKDLKHYPGLAKSQRADEATIKDYVRGSVPVIVISHKRSKRVVELRGQQSLATIMRRVNDVVLR